MHFILHFQSFSWGDRAQVAHKRLTDSHLVKEKKWHVDGLFLCLDSLQFWSV